jgi:mono/diheme cytochrome c family protein
VALVIVAGAALAVAASVSDNPIVEWYLSNTMIHSVTSRASAVKARPQFRDQQARAGFAIYNKTCVYCHGAPGKDPADIAKGLNHHKARRVRAVRKRNPMSVRPA